MASITNLILSLRSSENKLIWSFTRDGHYAVKSGYQVACTLTHACSQSIISKGWQLSVPLKVRTFMWRLCRDILPTRLNLLHMNILVPITCVMCQSDVKHAWLVFRDCPFAKACWGEAGFNFFLGTVGTVGEWILQLFHSNDSNFVSKVGMVLWSIWGQQNCQLWNHWSLTPARTVDSCFQY